MQLVHVYVNFPGTAEQALHHYERVFGTRILALMRFGDAPFAPKDLPEAAKAKIIHGQIPLTETIHLMASDVVEGASPRPIVVGNNFSISVVANDKAEADRVFAALADGGTVTMPIANAPWGPYFGMVTDRFAVQWMVSLPHPA